MKINVTISNVFELIPVIENNNAKHPNKVIYDLSVHVLCIKLGFYFKYKRN